MEFPATPSSTFDNVGYAGASPSPFLNSNDDNKRRRFSSRSIKRRHFDDELVEYSLQPGASIGKGEKRIRTQSYTSTVPEFQVESSSPITSLNPAPPPPPKRRRAAFNLHPLGGLGRNTRRKRLLIKITTESLRRWEPTDDLALILGVLQTNDLRTVHLGVKFSCRFTMRELWSRWSSLLYNAEVSRVAVNAIRNMHPALVAAVQQLALYSDAEEDLIGTLKSSPKPTIKQFKKLLEANRHIFYSTRTPKLLMIHWKLLKKYHLLPDQVVQPLPNSANKKRRMGGHRKGH